MAGAIHIIDQRADTVILLKDAGSSFAVWKERVPPDDGKQPRKCHNDMNFNNNVATEDETLESGIRYHVSSRHLMLASKHFMKALSEDGWKESHRKKDGVFYVSAQDWDARAFLILMNVFHLRNQAVPRSVSLEMLAKIAVLVDYYDCAEAMVVFVGIWVEILKKSDPVPSTYGRKLMLWMLVSWVFRLPQQFKHTTNIALTQCDDKSIQTMGLPISGLISSVIDHMRIKAIEDMISGLYKWIDTFRSAQYTCLQDNAHSFQCGAFLLGALSKEMDYHGLSSPRPEVPFDGLSVQGVLKKVLEMQSPTWYTSREPKYYDQKPHSCTLASIVNPMAENIVALIGGLDISYFLSKGDVVGLW
ncbi:uncharacterized protein BDR25DRAFT_382905 [Lindgomyces ingoldianus]|uniref:Uncharacterized protein n=1 Tax=Lindgomyces ingoldianus TaxID=673940 RepID=A0ACB6QAT7_9PLEO|nr:uncharacterized protein BDR25DRAFT_382905 [Lindgomyces ingoldianus]KAF2463995.1 hypothetical protein BDR25DRAFT_382905 [Lindgomyces ingoldianus]